MTQQYLVRAILESEAQVRFAFSDDVPRLATEAADLESLDAELQTMVPELLELNGLIFQEDISARQRSQRQTNWKL